MFKSVIAFFFMALVFTSCSPDTKEKVAEDAFSAMEEVMTVLEGVKDKATAEAASPKLKKLVDKVEGIKARQKALSITDEDFKKEMEKQKDRMGKLMGKMLPTLMKISADKEVEAIIGESMKKIMK